MTESQNIKLEAIKNRATRYELVLQRGAERLRLCYTGRKNRHGLIDAIRRNGAELVQLTGAEAFKLEAGPAAIMGDWRLSFSGRTQREAIIAGELAWFWSGQSRIAADVEITPKA
jgi:hypothetical protein